MLRNSQEILEEFCWIIHESRGIFKEFHGIIEKFRGISVLKLGHFKCMIMRRNSLEYRGIHAEFCRILQEILRNLEVGIIEEFLKKNS